MYKQFSTLLILLVQREQNRMKQRERVAQLEGALETVDNNKKKDGTSTKVFSS